MASMYEFYSMMHKQFEQEVLRSASLSENEERKPAAFEALHVTSL